MPGRRITTMFTKRLMAGIFGLALLSYAFAVQVGDLSKKQVDSLVKQGYSQADINHAATIVHNYHVGLDAVMEQYRSRKNWQSVEGYFEQLRQENRPADLVWNPDQLHRVYNLSLAKIAKWHRSGMSYDDIAEAANIAERYHADIYAVIATWKQSHDWNKVRTRFAPGPNTKPGRIVWRPDTLKSVFGLSDDQISSLVHQGLSYDGVATAAQISQKYHVSLDDVMAQWRKTHNWNRVRAYFKGAGPRPTPGPSPVKQPGAVVWTRDTLKAHFGLSDKQITSLTNQGLSFDAVATAAQISRKHHVSLDEVMVQWRASHNWNAVKAHFGG